MGRECIKLNFIYENCSLLDVDESTRADTPRRANFSVAPPFIKNFEDPHQRPSLTNFMLEIYLCMKQYEDRLINDLRPEFGNE